MSEWQKDAPLFIPLLPHDDSWHVSSPASRNFLVRREFLSDPQELRNRLRLVAVVMLLLSPFLAVFMLIYFFLRNAEQFYHQPSSAGSRRWSNLALWKFREFNEVGGLEAERESGGQSGADMCQGGRLTRLFLPPSWSTCSSSG